MDNSYVRVFDLYADRTKILGIRNNVETFSFAVASSNEFVRMFCAIVDRSEIRELLQLRNIEHGNHGISSCFRKKENKFLRLLYFLTR